VLELVSQEFELDGGGGWRAGPCTVSMDVTVIQKTACKKRVALDFL
jgi:hypothetical protein